MILGLVAPMRLGTGYGIDDILRRRKFYKYRQFDRKNKFKEMKMGVREFCELLKQASCEYCGSKTDIGLDRKNNNDGHHEANVIYACKLCNMTRGNRFTVIQMKKIGKIIRTFL